ncbi:class I glutamine amidotransferase-like protein [Karstenula rhodostoma CBS 690.94]|uniref:Class I glutamine amidotransferase-like protein n=1 Tax=Karstenula rhodostoma CBS 690.94 TaxID=1392251 RepID=A0A9P4PV93_9PLEO|nr:class I glutamine amidotransferase-like protein [Karstenula rhodostoma CBS 690.94]
MSKLRIAMFNTDTPVPTVRSKWSTYGKMFEGLLVAAASRFTPGLAIETDEYDIQRFQYPYSLADIDVILITGSAAASYDADEWIRRLDDYVLDVYKNHRHVRMFGSCFGHQLICQSLLREYGVRVEKDPNGYELGVKELLLNKRFCETLGNGSVFSRKTPDSLRVQMIHGDHVVVPALESLPDSWIILGATQHCAMQGMYDPARIFTLQGHFEFDRFVNTELMKVFGAKGKWSSQMIQDGLEAVDADDDAEFIGEIVLQFMLEKGGSEGAAHRKIGGLLTPPFGED